MDLIKFVTYIYILYKFVKHNMISLNKKNTLQDEDVWGHMITT
jgi:hypothetical protein